MQCPGCHKQNREDARFCSGCGSALRQVDLCFVMDATGSMGKYINATREALSAFAQRLATQSIKPAVNYGLVLYRDYPAKKESPVTQCYDFSEHIDAFLEIFHGVRPKGGGGDGAEAVADGLYAACTTMTWRQTAHKILFLVGDAPPHGYGHARDRYPYGYECEKNHGTAVDIAQEAHKQGITIFSLGIGTDPVMIKSFADIAENGGGHYVPVDNVVTLIDSVLAIIMAEVNKA